MDDERNYDFSWELLGDVEFGRPNLGRHARVEMYRLMQYCLRDVVAKRYGVAATDEVFYEAGYLAGTEFVEHLIDGREQIGDYLSGLQRVLREMGVGVFRVEQADPATRSFVVTIAEDLDCSGLPESDDTTCTFDEGFLAAVFEKYTGRPHDVREVECWSTGDRICRFEAREKRE